MQLSKKAKLMKPSPILALAAKANELKASGKDVLSLTVGEPDWDTYDNIKEAAIKAIRSGMTKYTPSQGIVELRKAVLAQTNEDLGTKYELNQVTVSTGAKMVLFSALQAICDPGDEVLIPAPFWASYTTMVELADAKPRIVVCDESTGFKLTPELLRKGLSEKTKAILLNSPSNPTGLIYSAAELKALAEVLREFPRVAVLSDDIYNRLVFTKEKLAPHILHVAPDLVDRVIVLNGASKTYSMTGWRIGWALGPKDVIAAMTAYASQSVSCPASISQAAALEGVLHSQSQVEETVVNLQQRREFILGELASIEGIKAVKPEGAFYIWMDVSRYLGRSHKGRKLENTGAMAAALLEDHLVAVVPGVEFGLEGYFRLSYALGNEKAREAVSRMRDFFQTLS